MDRLILCSILALAVAGATAAAQGNPKPDSTGKSPPGQRVPVPAYRNRIVGVFDGQTFQPVEGAEVSDVMVGTKSLTSSTGNASLFFLPVGASLVRIRKLGYESQTFMVSITPQDSSPITVVLSSVTELPPVVTRDSAPRYISPGLQGFEERRKEGFGYFIDEAELRKDEGRQLSNEIVSHIPGVIMTLRGYLLSGRKKCSGPVLSPTCRNPSCFVAVYTDGVLTKPAPDFSRIETNDYAGVEFYASAAMTPAWIPRTNTDCGVLLLWTRER
jgi:hypothetical protein